MPFFFIIMVLNTYFKQMVYATAMSEHNYNITCWNNMRSQKQFSLTLHLVLGCVLNSDRCLIIWSWACVW
jgi:hypothetical protein